MITPDSPYFAQARLLVRVLPFVGAERCFALKGGTAINLFVRDVPRLSVDIDLAYLPEGDRVAALENIHAALGRIGAAVVAANPAWRFTFTRMQDGFAYAALVSDDRAKIKIEVTPVLRGCVYPEAPRRIGPVAEALLGFAEVRTLSFEDLFAGKIVAALDRQHPRDLYDAKLLLEREGLTKPLMTAFLVYLVSGDNRMSRTLQPVRKPLDELYDRQFVNMTADPVSLDELVHAREALIAAVHANLEEKDREFLLSFKRLEPRWELLDVPHARELPAVRWKLRNLGLMGVVERERAVSELAEALSMPGTDRTGT